MEHYFKEIECNPLSHGTIVKNLSWKIGNVESLCAICPKLLTNGYKAMAARKWFNNVKKNLFIFKKTDYGTDM